MLQKTATILQPISLALPIKDYEAQNACAGRTYINGHKIVFVDIDEDYFNKFYYGVQSFIMHHEMAHIVLEHRKSKKPGQQLNVKPIKWQRLLYNAKIVVAKWCNII